MWQIKIDFILENTPPMIHELMELIGLEATMRLVENLGGLDLYIPTHLDKFNGQRLIGLIGEDLTQKLMNRYAGERLYLPRCEQLFNKINDLNFCQAVMAEMEKGTGKDRAIQMFAVQFGITQRKGYYLLQNGAQQLELF